MKLNELKILVDALYDISQADLPVIKLESAEMGGKKQIVEVQAKLHKEDNEIFLQITG